MTRVVRPQGGGQQPVLTDEQLAWIVDQRDRRGRSFVELGAELHVHPSTVARWARRSGAKQRPRQLPHPNVNAISSEDLLSTMQLAGEGYSANDIATLLQIHPTSVRYRLRKYARDDSWRNRPHKLKEHSWPKGV